MYVRGVYQYNEKVACPFFLNIYTVQPHIHTHTRTPPCGGAGAGLLGLLPREVLLQVLAYLRAWDLAALGMTATAFAQPQGAIEEVGLWGWDGRGDGRVSFPRTAD